MRPQAKHISPLRSRASPIASQLFARVSDETSSLRARCQKESLARSALKVESVRGSNPRRERSLVRKFLAPPPRTWDFRPSPPEAHTLARGPVAHIAGS